MKTVEKLQIISLTYSKLHDCRDDKDLKDLNLTLSEYQAACDVISRLGRPGESTLTFIKNVADFFKKSGFTVDPAGVNYKISI